MGLRDEDVDRLRAAIGEDTFDQRFELVREAGSGGMGHVFEAIDRASGKRVAVKLLAKPADRERFAAEVAVLERLDHPAIVKYVRHGITRDGDPYLVMEWLVGESLSHRLVRGPLTVAESCVLGERIAGALEHAHAAKVVHRDVKPSNVILVGGAVDDARLIDFGVAKTDRDLTFTGQLIGTPGYMAPEQVRGQKGIDGRVDLFALGCVLYETMTGRGAFDGAEVMEVLARLLLHQPRAVDELVDDMPPRLSRLIAALLAKDPSRRLAEARVARTELAAIRAALAAGDTAALAAISPDVPEVAPAETATAGDQPDQSGALTSVERPSARSTRSSRLPLAIGGAAVVAIGVLAALVLIARDPAQPPVATTRAVAPVPAERCTEYVRDGCSAACAAGSGDACYLWGQGLYTGRGGFTVDRPAAVAAYVRGCDLGSLEACIKGATSMIRDDPRDAGVLAHAERMLAGACDRGASQACRHLGAQHLPGGALATDPSRGLRYLARACDGNDVPACIAVRKHLGGGLGDAASREVATASHARACERKLRVECDK